MPQILMIGVYFFPWYLALGLGELPEASVFHRLTTEGVPAVNHGKPTVLLPSPSMPDGLDSDSQQEVIRNVAGPRRSIDLLLRDSIVAPFVLKLSDVPTSTNEEPVRCVDLWFVAHGYLDSFRDEAFHRSLMDFAEKQTDGATAPKAVLLSSEQLRLRGLEALNALNLKREFSHASVELFGRVRLRSTRRIEVQLGEESIVIAATIDPRFTKDLEFPNRWMSLRTGVDGRTEVGAPELYEQSGSYTKITRLRHSADCLFIEHHRVFVEPVGWFGGRNLLRSKLPLAMQRSVRELRRRLKTFESEQEQ